MTLKKEKLTTAYMVYHISNANKHQKTNIQIIFLYFIIINIFNYYHYLIYERQ